MASVRGMVVGLWTACLLAGAGPAAAQPGREALRIDGFDLEQVASLSPGTGLVFSVFATPGASATVLIEGSPRLLALRESQPGVYEGTYTIATGERIDPQARVVATVWRDGAVVRSNLEEALLLDAAPPPSRSMAPMPLPGGPAAVPSQFPASPGRPPAGEPAWTPRPIPSVEPAPAPRLARAAMPVPISAAAAVPPAMAEETSCAACARVESIRAVEVESGATRAGKFAGGVAGALFGEDVGRAHARHVTGLLNVLGGKPPGGDAGPRSAWQATLRLPDGSQRTRRYDEPPPFRIGDTVRLEGIGADRP